MGIPKDKYFVLKDGTVIRSLFELSKALDSMQEAVFTHHVNANRNDFYNWIKDVVKDKALAEDVLNSRTNKEMQKFIRSAIERDITKKMAKPAKKTAPAKKAKETVQKAKEVVDNTKKHIKTIKIKTDGIEKFKKAISNFFKTPKKEKTFGKVHPKDMALGIKCPYKHWRCGVLEFLFGIIIGLLIALILTKVF